MVLRILKQVFKYIYPRKCEVSRGHEETKEEKLQKCLKPYQRYFFKAQDLIVWENPTESIFALLLVNAVFWFIVTMEWRFYGLLGTFALAVIIQEAWSQHIWPEIRAKPKESKILNEDSDSLQTQEGRLSVPEISRYATTVWAIFLSYFTKLKLLRAIQPGIFCALMSSVFLVLATIGRLISGLGLLYILVMGLMTIPGIFIHYVPPQTKEQIKIFAYTMSCLIRPSEASVDVEEYLPESSKENLEAFAMAGEVQTETNGSTSSLDECLMGSVMPSHEDSSMDALDSLSLDPSVPLLKHDSSDTDSDVDSPLRFKSTHFNGSSSSSVEDEKIAKNLNFPDIEEVSSSPVPGAGLAEAITKNLTKLGGNINLFSLLKASQYTAISCPPPQGDSSDSEFEIIESDDVS